VSLPYTLPQWRECESTTTSTRTSARVTRESQRTRGVRRQFVATSKKRVATVAEPSGRSPHDVPSLSSLKPDFKSQDNLIIDNQPRRATKASAATPESGELTACCAIGDCSTSRRGSGLGGPKRAERHPTAGARSSITTAPKHHRTFARLITCRRGGQPSRGLAPGSQQVWSSRPSRSMS
jgi:hypothetical protein